MPSPSTTSVLVSCPSCAHVHRISVNNADLQPNAGRERMYKISDVISLLGLSRRTIKQYIYDGKLRAQRFTDGPTSPWYISESALREFREARGG